MKKFMVLLLMILLLLCGCAEQEQIAAGPEFWYLRSSYQYGPAASMFASQLSNADTSDITEILQIYLQGPSSPGLRSPFPENTALLAYSEESGVASVTLTREFAEVSPAQIHCAAVCLVKTLAAVTDCRSVRIFLEDSPDTAYLQVSLQDFALTDDVITDVVESPEEEVVS